MPIGFNPIIRDNRIAQIRNALDADAANPGYIEFYTATRPATGAAITTQTLLGTCVLSKPCGTITNGILTFDAIADDVSADADGTIAWARFYDGAGNFVMDAGCGLTGSGETLIFNTLTVVTGGIIQVLSGTLTEGNA